MTETWYQAHTWVSKPYITEHQVERVTDKSIWLVQGGIFRRVTTDRAFYATRKEALQHCFEAVARKLQEADTYIASLQERREDWRHQLVRLEADILKEAT